MAVVVSPWPAIYAARRINGMDDDYDDDYDSCDYYPSLSYYDDEDNAGNDNDTDGGPYWGVIIFVIMFIFVLTFCALVIC